MDSLVAAELREVLAEYDLGELVDCEKNERGFVNTAYAICTAVAGQEHRYFLRKYKNGIREEELLFEHSLIEHMVAAGAPVACIHHTRTGNTYVRRPVGSNQAEAAFYTVFDFLPGEDRFTWVDPDLNQEQLSDSAAVLARFHLDGAGFTPLGSRGEPKIRELLPIIARTWSGCPARSKGTAFDSRITERLESVSASIAATHAALQEPAALALPEMVIHCDYHPGNLKYSGNRVTGMFDFDWSKVDLRIFDVGLALWYFCTSWREPRDGEFRLDLAEAFLSSYQKTLAVHAPSAAITREEAQYLPVMVNAGNLYVMHWTILDYFSKDADPAEYLYFLDHSLNFALWYEEPRHRQALEEMTAAVLAHSLNHAA